MLNYLKTASFLFFTVALLFAGQGLGESAPESEKGRFRLGPFFERRTENGETSFLAVRPFFSWEYKKEQDQRDLDVVWPISTFGRRAERVRNRILTIFYTDDDRNDPESGWHISAPPIWGMGRTNHGVDHWALFPFYGYIPNMLIVNEFRFVLFPLYVSYEVGKTPVPRKYFLWPFFSLKEDPDKTRWSLWPIYGTKKETDFDSRFAFWPLWTEKIYHDQQRQKNGHAWMLFPLMARVDTDTEQGWSVIPPFFSRTTTERGATLLRCPWPLEHYTDPNENTWRFWRIFGVTHRGSRDGWWFLHPIVVFSHQETERVENTRRRIWPLYTFEEDKTFDKGTETVEESYFRIWPLFSRAYSKEQGERIRVLELMPIRDSAPIERNFAPFWTLYECTHTPGESVNRHDLFWGLIKWTTEADDE